MGYKPGYYQHANSKSSVSSDIITAFWHLSIVEMLIVLTFGVILILLIVNAVIYIIKKHGFSAYFKKNAIFFMVELLLILSFCTFYILSL